MLDGSFGIAQPEDLLFGEFGAGRNIPLCVGRRVPASRTPDGRSASQGAHHFEKLVGVPRRWCAGARPGARSAGDRSASWGPFPLLVEFRV